MRVVRGNDLDLVFRRQVEERGIDFPLIFVDFQGETRDLGLVEHYLQIVVFAEQTFVPFNGFLGALDIPGENMLGRIACQTGGRGNQVPMVFLQNFPVDPRFVVEAFNLAK